MVFAERLHLYSRSSEVFMFFCYTFVTEGTSGVYYALPFKIISDTYSIYIAPASMKEAVSV